MKHHFVFKFFITGISLLFFTACTEKSLDTSLHASIEIKRAWVRTMPQNIKITAGYMELHNHGTSEDLLLSAESPIASKVEIHKTVNNDGVMSMVPVPSIPVPAKGLQELKPGGYHLMMILLKKVPKIDEKVHLSLNFKHAGRIELIATVGESPMKDMKHNSKKDHSEHGMKNED